MTFYSIVSIIGTFVSIAVAGLITYIQRKNPSRKQITQYSVVISIVLVCVIILAIGIPYFSGLDGSSFQASRGASTSPLDTALNSSGAMFGYDAQHTHFNPHEHLLSPVNVSRLRPYWTALTGDWVDSSPTVANGKVYVGSYDGKLYAFNASSGVILWTAHAGDGIAISSAAVANGVVYIGSQDGELYAFNASDGTIRWRAPEGNSITSSPAVANNVVYVGSWDHQLQAFNARNGTKLWTASTGGAIDYSSPAVANGVAYVGSEDNKLHTFHLLSTIA